MILWTLLIAHFLADFTFQSADWANKKTEKFRYLLGHALVYAILLATATLVCIPANNAWLPIGIIVLSHFIIDGIRILLDKHTQSKLVHFASFVIDQALHIGIIYLVCHIFGLNNLLSVWVCNLSLPIDIEKTLRYALIFIIILDPAAVFVKKLSFYIAKEGSTPSHKKEPPIGRVIGKLERIIIAILVMCNEIGAIGFVLTAKSLARYKQLNDQNFAEKYLVGTLSSTAIAIIGALMLK